MKYIQNRIAYCFNCNNEIIETTKISLNKLSESQPKNPSSKGILIYKITITTPLRDINYINLLCASIRM